jgi:hypothetical protein
VIDDLPAEDYRGVATLRAGDGETRLPVRLSARFEPVEGRYRWAGRTGPDAALCALVQAGVREATVTIGDGPAVPARLSEPDPWGGVRLSGTGTPPWHQFRR